MFITMKIFKIVFSILGVAIFFTAVFALLTFLHKYFGLLISPTVLTINNVLIVLTPIAGIITMLSFISMRQKLGTKF